MKLRYEDFGGIIAIEEPPALLWVDREMVRELGYADGPTWVAPMGHLSAPTEVHLMTTNRCHAGCPGCYAASVPEADDASTASLLATIDALADAGVFHVAMGGGESLLRGDLFALAAHARARGMVPNLTTSGVGLGREEAERCRVFGQVNVSLDGRGETFLRSRGYDGAEVALRALRRLSAAGVPCGINYVLSRATWDDLEDTAAEVAALGANEIEVLRFKPAGRGAEVYESYRLTPEQGDALLPRLVALGASLPELAVKIDCSLVPLLCAANPPSERLEQFAVFGCEAGHALAAVRADLSVSPCSFLAPVGAPASLEPLGADWVEGSLAPWRAYHENAPEPCASCAYRSVCKGGCRAVSLHVTGDALRPDPECPRVRRYESAGQRDNEEACS